MILRRRQFRASLATKGFRRTRAMNLLIAESIAEGIERPINS